MDERKRIGDLLLEAGVVTEEQLREALAEQERSGGRLCYNLIRLGHLSADDLTGFLRDQFGVAAVNLERYEVPEAVLRLLPDAFARSRRVVPLSVRGKRITVAMVDPSRAEDVAAVREVTGLEPEPVISPEASVEAALRRFYPAEPAAAGAGDGVLELVEEIEGAAPEEGRGGEGEEWLRRFLLEAIRRRSREIHLEPLEEGLRARYRVRGVLQEGQTAPREAREAVARRAEDLAGLRGAAGAGRPAEGRFRIHVRRRWLRATLSAFPTLYGERLVVRIVDESLLAREFQELGMSKEVADEAQRLLAARTGILLINAPPGQGRRTTFYSFLACLKGEGGRNIMTLESPVRYPIAGVSQTQVGPGEELDVAGGLRAMLHQEPDVIGVTDLPDRATLELAFGAARRCLVIAIAGFRDNLQALTWIRDSGISPATQGLLLRGLVAQRLLPKLCSGCREPLQERVRLLEGVRDTPEEQLEFYAAAGCEQCGGSGRTGRVALFELLSFRGELRDLLLAGEAPQVVVDEAQRRGMWTIREDGVLKASHGLADIREVLEATGDEVLPR